MQFMTCWRFADNLAAEPADVIPIVGNRQLLRIPFATSAFLVVTRLSGHPLAEKGAARPWARALSIWWRESHRFGWGAVRVRWQFLGKPTSWARGWPLRFGSSAGALRSRRRSAGFQACCIAGFQTCRASAWHVCFRAVRALHPRKLATNRLRCALAITDAIWFGWTCRSRPTFLRWYGHSTFIEHASGTRTLRRFGNLRYSRLGSLRYVAATAG